MLYRFKDELGSFVFWSNHCGDLQWNGKFNVKASTLPSELQVAYNNLWSSNYPVTCYLAEFNTQLGIALALHYEDGIADAKGLSHEELVIAAHEKAVRLSRKYPNYDVIFGEDSIVWRDFSKDTIILVMIPWDTKEDTVNEIARYMDCIGYDIHKDSIHALSNTQLAFEDYKSIILDFVEKIEVVDSNLDIEEMSEDDCLLFSIIRQCRNKLMDVHNKINDKDWVMPKPFKEED